MSTIRTRPAETDKFRLKNKGMAAHIAAIAYATYDPLAASMLRAAVPQIARMEQALDELVDEAVADVAGAPL